MGLEIKSSSLTEARGDTSMAALTRSINAMAAAVRKWASGAAARCRRVAE